MGAAADSRHNGRAVNPTLRAYLELSRLSNAPTILSNVLVGTAIGAASAAAPLSWVAFIVMTLAMLLLYVGGMALNDWMDAEVDARERPGRPIPSGRVPSRAALVYAVGSMAAGVAIAATFGYLPLMLATALAACIVLYNAWHTRFAASAVLMGACRGLVYLTAAAAAAEPLARAGSPPLELPIALPPAIALTAYIALVTLIARGETGERPSPIAVRLSVLTIAAALAPALFVVPGPGGWAWAVPAALVMIAWLLYAQSNLIVTPPRIKRAVMAYLAGICLVDAFFLTLLELPAMAIVAGACFVITAALHRAVPGT
jgi:heme O synthase-like polyprenyltransferase